VYERSEIVTQQRVRAFVSADPASEGLTATLDDAGLVTVNYASIEGSSSLRIPGSMLAALQQLVVVIAEEDDLLSPPDEPEPDPEPEPE
jgi:hypothetical protein